MTKNDETTDIEWIKKGLVSMETSQKQLQKEMRIGFKEVNNRLDMYREHFETQENAERSRTRIWKKIKEIENKRLKEIMDTKANKEDLQKIEDFKTWVVRIVIGAVILAVLGLVISN